MFGTGTWEGSAGDASVVYEDVEAAEFGIEVVVSGLIVDRQGDVELEHICIDAGCAEFCGCLLALGEKTRADDNFDARVLQVKCSLETKATVIKAIF